MREAEIKDATLELIKGDITKQQTEAIVNAANERLAPGGGVAGAIHRAAGAGLWDECKNLGGCATGKAKLTAGHDLPASYIIHTVGPVYSGSSEDAKHLASCYRECLRIARENNIRSIAFPAISTGAFGYPVEEAAEIALKTLVEELRRGEEIDLVRLVLYNEEDLEVHQRVFDSLDI